MAEFTHFQHERWKVQRKVDTVSITVNVHKGKPKTLFSKDRVVIRLHKDDYLATLRLDDTEIEALVYEVKRIADKYE